MSVMQSPNVAQGGPAALAMYQQWLAQQQQQAGSQVNQMLAANGTPAPTPPGSPSFMDALQQSLGASGQGSANGPSSSARTMTQQQMSDAGAAATAGHTNMPNPAQGLIDQVNNVGLGGGGGPTSGMTAAQGLQQSSGMAPTGTGTATGPFSGAVAGATSDPTQPSGNGLPMPPWPASGVGQAGAPGPSSTSGGMPGAPDPNAPPPAPGGMMPGAPNTNPPQGPNPQDLIDQINGIGGVPGGNAPPSTQPPSSTPMPGSPGTGTSTTPPSGLPGDTTSGPQFGGSAPGGLPGAPDLGPVLPPLTGGAGAGGAKSPGNQSGNYGGNAGTGTTAGNAAQEAARNAANQQQGLAGDPNLQGYGSPQGQAVPPGGGMIPTGGGLGVGGGVSPLNSLMPQPIGAPLNAQGQQFLQGVYGSFQNAQDAANAANKQQYNNVMGGYNQLGSQQAGVLGGLAGMYGQTGQQFGSNANSVLGGYNDLLNAQTKGYGNVGSGYNQLLNNQMSRLGLLGQTQATDLQQQYDQQHAKANQDLVSRGLGNTTIQQSTDRGIDFDKARALTNLAQNVAAQMNTTEMGAALPMLQQQNQALGSEAGIAQTGLGAQQDLAGQQAQIQQNAINFGNQAQQEQTGLGQNQLNFMQSVNQTGPDYGQLAQLATAIGQSGTGVGTNGFNNMPSSFPSQAPVGPLGGASLTGLGGTQAPQGQPISALQGLISQYGSLNNIPPALLQQYGYGAPSAA